MSDFKVPQGWQVEYLKNLSTDGIKNGVFNDPKKVGEGAKLINVVNLYNGAHINTEKLTRLSLTEKEIAKYKVEVGDVFFTRSSLVLNGIAQCNINLDDSDDIVFDGHVMRVRPNSKKVVPFYLKEFCLSDSAKKFFMRHAKTTTMTTIGQEEVGKLPVLLPPKEEQEKIVAILSSWDKAIELKEKLIEQKKEQKKGLMQKLLSGELRLQNFKDEWREVQLSKIVKKTKGKAVETVSEGNYPIIDMDYLESGTFKNFTNDASTLAQKKDVLLLWDGSRAGMAFTGAEGSVGSTFVKLECKSVNNIFLQKNLEMNEKKIQRLREGSGIPHVPKDFLTYYKVKLPSLQEQEVIAKVLVLQDQELLLLESEIANLKSQKKALMQQLLTGKIRVKV